jgi:hypothetical protein
MNSSYEFFITQLISQRWAGTHFCVSVEVLLLTPPPPPYSRGHGRENSRGGGGTHFCVSVEVSSLGAMPMWIACSQRCMTSERRSSPAAHARRRSTPGRAERAASPPAHGWRRPLCTNGAARKLVCRARPRSGAARLARASRGGHAGTRRGETVERFDTPWGDRDQASESRKVVRGEGRGVSD